MWNILIFQRSLTDELVERQKEVLVAKNLLWYTLQKIVCSYRKVRSNVQFEKKTCPCKRIWRTHGGSLVKRTLTGILTPNTFYQPVRLNPLNCISYGLRGKWMSRVGRVKKGYQWTLFLYFVFFRFLPVIFDVFLSKPILCVKFPLNTGKRKPALQCNSLWKFLRYNFKLSKNGPLAYFLKLSNGRWDR
jgi:hypothetical protein